MEVELVETIKKEIVEYFKISLDSPRLKHILSKGFSTSFETIKKEIAEYFNTSPDDFWEEEISLVEENTQDSLWSEEFFSKDFSMEEGELEEGELDETNIICNEYLIETSQEYDSWKKDIQVNSCLYEMTEPRLPQTSLKRNRSNSDLNEKPLRRNNKRLSF